MRSRRLKQLAGVAALAAMLFAQAAFALAACDPVRAPSRAMMIVLENAQPCHPPADNANLCFTHCQSEAQTLDKHQVKLPALPVAPVLMFLAWQKISPSVHRAPRAPIATAGPPPRILFSSLLI